MSFLAARRRHPAAIFFVLLFGLVFAGGAYAFLAPRDASANTASSQQIEEGRSLFIANCASCHGVNAQGVDQDGPSLVGVGAAAVDFQVGTGRMPMAMPGVQAQRGKQKFTDEERNALSAYVASLGPGPGIPTDEQLGAGNVEAGGELFRVNCAMCHNFAGSGGALTRGKYAPSLKGVENRYIYEAMLTGPQSMPVFNDTNLTPQAKADILAYLDQIDSEPSPGGADMGKLGPVSEGLFFWTIGIGSLVGIAVWLGRKAA